MTFLKVGAFPVLFFILFYLRIITIRSMERGNIDRMRTHPRVTTTTQRERERERGEGEKVSHLLVYSNFKCLRLWKCAVPHRCAALISNPGRVIIVRRHERSALHHCYEQWSNKQATASLSLCAPRPFIWTHWCVYNTFLIRFLFYLHHVVIVVPAQRGVVPGLLSDLRVID